MPERIKLDGAGKGGVDYMEIPLVSEQMIDALLREAVELKRRGDTASLANIGEQIRHWRYSADNSEPAGKEYRADDTAEYEGDDAGNPEVEIEIEDETNRRGQARSASGRVRLQP